MNYSRLLKLTPGRLRPGKTLGIALAAVLLLIISLVIHACIVRRAGHTNYQSIQHTDLTTFLARTDSSLINLRDPSMGGWRFQSAIQAPHYQTDRDVGAAGVGISFLALAQKYPHDKRWLAAAKQTAIWLTAVSKQNKDGRYWPDYVDSNGASPDVYTSFDDGSIGIGDFFWQLYEATHDPQDKRVALQSLQWTFSQAEPYDQNGISAYRWRWDVSDKHSPYYMGMGEGAAGLTYAFATYYERLRYSNPQLAAECKLYMQGSLNYIQIVQQKTGSRQAIPETGVLGRTGDTTLDSGYLSGAAGNAFMYLKLYQVFGDKIYLDQAQQLLNWLADTKSGPMVRVSPGAYAWRLALDSQGGDDNQYATGFEEGAAGIGWVFLQAYKQTGQKQYLGISESAANWLLETAIKGKADALSWHEDEHATNQLTHANLNNGAAGIGLFLHDLYLGSGQQKYQAGAKGALKWLMDTARQRGEHNQYIYWSDNGGNDPYSNDPSWHWGLAGIIEFLQRLDGGASDIPGEQPALQA